MGFLEVVIPPDILNEDGAPDDYVAVEGGSVRVRCKATGVPEPTVLWRREDSQPIILRADGTREKQGTVSLCTPPPHYTCGQRALELRLLHE